MRSRTILLPLFVLALAGPFAARVCAGAEQGHAAHTRNAGHPAPSPAHAIGKFEDWTAATHQEAGQTVCYAFTRASSSTPAVPGRGDVVLTVTQRPVGVKDVVAISAGFAFAPNSVVQMQVEQTALTFYTAQRSAFARDGHATVAAFARGLQAVAKSPAPHNATVTDVFNLRGFSPAFAAINKACAVKG